MTGISQLEIYFKLLAATT